MSKDKRIFDLEERLISFAVRIIRTAESLPKTRAGNHIAGQINRCGTAEFLPHVLLFEFLDSLPVKV